MAGYIVAQLGARMHYAVPRILQEAGLLERLNTDICASKGWFHVLNWAFRSVPSGTLKRLFGRKVAGINPSLISTFTGFGLKYYWRIIRVSSPEDRIRTYLWASRTFNEKILQQGFGRATGVYGFNTSSLEILVEARRRGLTTVLEQTIAPYDFERKLLEEECAAFPDWEPAPAASGLAEEFATRERSEWTFADRILCGSTFARNALQASGGPVDRCEVVPYGIEGSSFAVPNRMAHSGPLRALTIGTIGLRKGTPYLLAAARQTRGRVIFRLVGNVAVPQAIAKQLEAVADVVGPVPRSEIGHQFAWADVFVLPSICEGSATATYEALAAGLPVICTPNTGSLVRDGIDGFIVPVRSSAALVERLDTLARHSWLVEQMSQNAKRRSSDLSLDAYAARLLAALERVASKQA